MRTPQGALRSVVMMLVTLAVACADNPTDPSPQLQTAFLTDAPRAQMSTGMILAAASDPEQTDGTLLIGVKEPVATRGVTLGGLVSPVSARLDAETAIRTAFPQLEVLRGISREITVYGPDGIRVDTLYRTALTVRVPGGAQMLDALRGHPNVDYIAPNYWNGVNFASLSAATPALPRRQLQTRPWGVDSVRAPAAWSLGYRGDGTSVGVVDNGADFSPIGHPDLAYPALYGMFANLVDHNTDNPCTSSTQLCWWEQPFHGTGVLGMAMALDNSQGSVGSAPDNATPLVAKVTYVDNMGAFRLRESDFADGVQYINEKWDFYTEPIRVAVTSTGYLNQDTLAYPTLHDQFRIASQENNVLWFAAAGNNEGGYVVIPARFQQVVAVSALSQDLTIADFSSIGPEVELSAPGVGLRVSWNRQDDDCCANEFTSLEDGTSYAAPLAAGVARIALDKYPSWSAAQLRQELGAHARDLGAPGRDNSYGEGMVDAICILNQLVCPPPPPLSAQIDGPTFVPEYEPCEWEGDASNGAPPYTYKWYRDGALVGTSRIYNANTGDDDFTLRLEVRDSGAGGASDQIWVTVDIEGEGCWA